MLGNAPGPFHDRINVVSNGLSLEAEFLGPVHQVKHFGGAQHRLGRDTPPVEADTAEMLPLHNRGLQPQLRRTDRRHIASWSRPDHDDVELFCGHAVSSNSGLLIQT